MNEIIRSHIIISAHFDMELEGLKSRFKPHRVVSFIKDDFLLDDAKAAVSEAFISESSTKYIVLAGKSFRHEAQNSLLKVLEEPPAHIEFIIIAPNKSVLLPTIRSRLPMVQKIKEHSAVSVDIKLGSLDIREIFDFVKSNDRLAKHDAKALIEGLFYQATVVEKLVLTSSQLKAFDNSYRLLNVNGRLQTLLLALLMQFLPKKKK
jgi:DNA polymerase-3 subunit delta'